MDSKRAMMRFYATFFFTFALLLGVEFLSFAQESNTHQYGNGTMEGQNDKNDEIATESENIPLKSHIPKQDSILAKPAIKIKQATDIQKSVRKEDEDAVSFNFLYYVIQRFKSSDIIED